MHNDEIEKENWRYLAEGNSSIVYACDLQVKLVLRVKKRYSREKVCEGRTNEDEKAKLENDQCYVDKILKPLFRNEEYFLPTEIVTLSEDSKEKLKSITLSATSRPDERSLQSFELGSSAILMPHLGFYEDQDNKSFSVSSYAVEIKPKWGFLPTMSNMVGGEHLENDLCRFCMHQYLKMKSRKTSSLSAYCPLDLFANCSCRLLHALHSLFQDPQNNLRVFHDGTLIYSGLAVKGVKENLASFKEHLMDISTSSKSTRLTDEHLINIISSILIHDSWHGLNCDKNTGQCTARVTPICKSRKNVPLENKNCVSIGPKGALKRLAELQQINTIDAGGIKSIIDSATEGRDLFKSLQSLENYASEQWDEFVMKMTSENMIEGEKTSTDDMILMIQRFLVSATFKDCSIMITFKEKVDKQENMLEESVIKEPETGVRYSYSIKLIDLDPKKIAKIDYYEKLDHDILKAYAEHLGQSCK